MRIVNRGAAIGALAHLSWNRRCRTWKIDVDSIVTANYKEETLKFGGDSRFNSLRIDLGIFAAVVCCSAIDIGKVERSTEQKICRSM